MVVAVICIFAILMLFDLPKLIKGGVQIKVMLTYLLLMSIGLAISLIVILELPVISPTQVIESAVGYMLGRR
mgnify:CR=1 FL=1